MYECAFAVLMFKDTAEFVVNGPQLNLFSTILASLQ